MTALGNPMGSLDSAPDSDCCDRTDDLKVPDDIGLFNAICLSWLFPVTDSTKFTRSRHILPLQLIDVSGLRAKVIHVDWQTRLPVIIAIV